MREPIIQRFLEKHQPGRGFVGGIDDPTYMSFWLDFNFNGNIVEGDYDAMPHGLLAPKEHNYSAEQYLRNIGYSKRGDNIRVFREILRKIIREAPWTISGLDGLKTAYEIKPGQNWREKDAKITVTLQDTLDMRANALVDLYRFAAYDTEFMRYLLPDIMRYFKMTIYISEFRTFHEPIVKRTDWEKPEMDNLKDQPTSDPWSLPDIDNLRARGQQLYDQYFKEPDVEEPLGEYFLKTLDKKLSIIKLDFEQCEIDLESIEPSWLENASNTTLPNRETVKFDIKIGKVKEMRTYPVIEAIINLIAQIGDEDGPTLSGDNFSIGKLNKTGSKTMDDADEINKKLRQRDDRHDNEVYKKTKKRGHLSDPSVDPRRGIEKIGERMIDDTGDIIGGAITDYVATEVKKVYLGNVYGISPAELQRRITSNPATIAWAAQDLIGRTAPPSSPPPSSDLGNVYE